MNNWGFDLTDFNNVWLIILQITLLLGFLLIGNILRRLVPFLRKAFIPSALLGGILLFLVNLFFTGVLHIDLVNKRIMEIITYHSLAVGFIASTLRIIDNKKKVPLKESLQNGAITGGTYMLQAVCGILVSLIFFWVSTSFFYDAGVLLPLGFGQGPGNALTWDKIFSGMDNNSFDGNGSVGLTIASIGFIVASIVGVIYINIYAHKGEIIHREEIASKDVSKYESENEIKDSDSVDKFSIQIAIVAICFALSFLTMFGFAKLSETTGIDLFNSVAWGFNFIWGVIAASLIKLAVKFLEKKKIMKHRYINNYQMDRISGFAFDLMIIAGVAAIDVEVVGKYIWFILILSGVGTVITLIYVRLMTKRCFKDYQHEAFLVNYGTLTGTASNGMILLKEVDPNGKTPMSNIFVLSQLPAMVFVAPLLLLLKLSANSLNGCYIAMGIFGGLFILYTLFLLFSPKIFARFAEKKKEKAGE